MAQVPTPSLEGDGRIVAGRIGAKLREANARLKGSRDWYEGVRRSYGHP